ncbi:MAG: sensor histidine kinase [Saprospiraceae bacterium]|nr:sensor histidine kinase [Saprospiraceae bacterium]
MNGQKTALDSIFNLAVTKSVTGDVPGTTALLLTAQKMAEAENNQQMLCLIQVAMGKMAMIAENNEGVEEATQKALRLCSGCKDTLSIARTYLQIGVLKLKYEQYDSAINAFKLSSAYYLLKKDTMGAANAIAKIGNALELQGRNTEANAYYINFYNTTKKAPESIRFLTANIYLTANYLNIDQYDKAFEHNQMVKKISQQLGAAYEYSASLRYDAQIFRQKQEYKKAYDALYHYVEHYQDTLMSKMQLEEAEGLKAKYEDEKKENQIALQEAQLSQERYKFWAVLGGLLMAVVAGLFLFQLARKLRKRNQEKEFLIKEIHHRVKNNLQILSSLLYLQSRQISDDTALQAVREGQNRVDAMGLIHQKLYMGDNVAKVEMKDYLEQFGQNMLDSFGIEDERVKIEYEVTPLYLDVDTAIPLGLIINELVTNALKYAFPDGKMGIIRIALWKNEQNFLCLKVSDNGVGRLNAKNDDKSTSFGTNLVQMLGKKLKGIPEVLTTDQGYATQIVFEKWV